jgi:F0F1-type ATP synthase epsilon subunit
MLLEIVSPNKIIFGRSDFGYLPGVDGSFQILNNHALVSILGKVL